ncbi:MAG TPA: GNAT family N-acetyltransferase [Chthoniobacterales bacterium]
MNEIDIQPFNAEQLAPLVALFEAQLREHGIPTSPDALFSVLRTLEAQPQHGFLLTAVCDGSAVGVAYAASILSLEHGGRSGWLEELYVQPAWRGRGVGTRLLKAVVAAAGQRGWQALDVEVDAAHQRVVSLYARHGFQPVHRSRFVRHL